ncbi:MAG TPA: TIGR03618 family F420-dependent PPOX class oxidoreductase [Myxococcota bacterium]|nr:TIGR03618 family F420-dependent PPOX class oxidoreductase [Myxococcota bacterium]
MPSRRDQIRMSDDEIWKFIEGRKSLQVATLNRDGSPHLTTLWFGILDGDIVFETFTKSQKIVNLKRDPRIAVLVEDGLEYNELRGVSINGRAELHEDPAVVFRHALAVTRKNNPGLTSEQHEAAAKMLSVKRTAVVVKPERIVSWDHRRLGGRY